MVNDMLLQPNMKITDSKPRLMRNEPQTIEETVCKPSVNDLTIIPFILFLVLHWSDNDHNSVSNNKDITIIRAWDVTFTKD